MHGYLRRDSDFMWTKGNEAVTNNDRRNITLSDGDPMRGQRGDASPGHSRLSTLTIFDARESDGGMYTCFVAGTEQEASIQLRVSMIRRDNAL